MSSGTETVQRPFRDWPRAVVILCATCLLIGISLLFNSSPEAALPTTPISSPSVPYINTPITSSSTVPPLVMLALSRDEQLSIKAYTDYTDLNGDGVIDSTYNDTFAYSGYFDSTLCYTNTTKALFAAAALATGTNGHQCSGQWSGNFLNWLTMTRMDIVRYVLFGGKRVTASDTAATTILQRAYLPDDTHSFQKVYSGSDIGNYTPFSVPMSFCNTSDVGAVTAFQSGYKPLLRVARGSFPQWASTEVRQCDWRDAAGSSNTTDQPVSTAAGSDELQVFVEVCDNASFRESFCRKYTNGATASYKPAGLLQQYGEGGQMRFGLITGTYDHSRTGGYVRRNIGQLSQNDTSSTTGCATGDEINFKNGTFCNQAANSEGIINSLQRLQIMLWPNNPFSGSNSAYSDCAYPTNRGGNGLAYSPSTDSTAVNRLCTDWGNPLAEIYGEALRYIEGNGNQPTAGFVPTTGAYNLDSQLGLPVAVNWTDPYNTNNYCASCSLIVLSTGFGSFDSDEIPNVPNLGDATAAAATTRLGNIEQTLVGNISGNDIVGYYGATPTQTGGTDITGGSANGGQPSTANAICSVKAVSDLALVRGVCPEQPNTEGSYQIAGLAFDAWTHDLRPDLQGLQSVKTYTVALAETLPSLKLSTSSGSISLSPLCKTGQSDPTTGLPVTGPTNNLTGTVCSLNDVGAQPLAATSTAFPFSGTTFGIPTRSDGKAGTLTFVWEDQPWGSDRDRDIIEMLSYCVGSACVGTNICQDKIFKAADGSALRTTNDPVRNACPTGVTESNVGADQVLIRTEMISASTGNNMRAGFSVSGSTADGPYATVNHFGSGGDTSSVITGAQVPYTNGGRLGVGNAPVVVRLNAGSSSVNVLKNPLFYAAKYGGFSYTAGTSDPKPSNVSQWDSQFNSTGAPGSDGLPDNYFPVSNPAQLQAQLAKVFGDIGARSGSGTAAAVVGSDRQGQGVVYQALFENQHKDAVNSQISATWIGTVQALFVDSQGRLREDGNGDAALTETSLSTDPVVTVTYDPVQKNTVITRDTGSGPASAALSSLKPLWSARKSLASLASVDQRTWGTNASTGRYIFTFMDYNQNSIVDANEQIQFVTCNGSCNDGIPVSGGTDSNWGMLNVNNRNAVSDLVNYVRGTDTTINGVASRNRTIQYSTAAGDTAQTQRLGDIVNSNPVAVDTPSESFDLLYNDASYGTYYAQYRNRRTVIYAGANDGMIHAFNGGFYDPQNKKFALSGSNSEVQHPLGSEIWAYIPYNLLPHLTWLTDPSYGHTWYVDGSPRVFDARIFANDADHPGGWGTVMVVGFRFGGGPLTLKSPTNRALKLFTGSNGQGLNQGDTISTRPAYVVMDITNPESTPKVLAEISGSSATDGRLGYTTGFPTVAAFKGSASGDVEKWYLIFGTGPGTSSIEPAVSSQNAGLYVYDLGTNGGTNRGFVTGYMPFDLPGATNSSTGDPVSVDWNLDYKANALYVGTVNTTYSNGAITAQSGKLYKLNFNNSSTPSAWTNPTASILNPGNPVIGTPSVTYDEAGRHWVFAGTGRFLAQADKITVQRQSLFGMIDTQDASTPTTPNYGNFIDVTSAVVTTDGAVAGVSGSTTQDMLVTNVAAAGGWKLNLAQTGTGAAERVVTPTAILGDVLFATGFTPSGSACDGDGRSELFGLYYKTGTPRSDIPTFGTTLNSNGNQTLVRTIDLGAGIGAAPSLRVNGSAGGNPVTIFTQTSSGAINSTAATLKNNLKSGEIDWRENHPTYKQ